MANRRSTVEFTEVVEPLLAALLIGGFDIKSIVNGGIVAFFRLSGDEQKAAIAEANGAKPNASPKKSLQEALNKIKQVVEIEKDQPGTIVQIMSQEECASFDEFRRLVGPKSKKQKKKTKRG